MPTRSLILPSHLWRRNNCGEHESNGYWRWTCENTTLLVQEFIAREIHQRSCGISLLYSAEGFRTSLAQRRYCHVKLQSSELGEQRWTWLTGKLPCPPLLTTRAGLGWVGQPGCTALPLCCPQARGAGAFPSGRGPARWCFFLVLFCRAVQQLI